MAKIKRVVFCTYPCLYSSLVLERLLRSPSIEVVAVIASTRNLRSKENKLASDIERIKVSGIRYASYLLIVTQLYRFFPSFFQQASFEDICHKSQIPIIPTQNINELSTQEELHSINPDVIFCTHFNQLIHPSTYSLAKEAAVNLHPSLLPDLKGVDPVFYALADSYNETGVTIHHLAEDFDTGKIISQIKQAITTEDTLVSLNKKLFQLGAELFINYIADKQSTNNSINAEQSERYDSWPSRSKVKKFKRHRNFIFTRSSFK